MTTITFNTQETKRELRFDLNADGSIAGAFWTIVTTFSDPETGAEAMPPRTRHEEAKPEEIESYLAVGHVADMSKAKRYGDQIAALQAELTQKNQHIVELQASLEKIRGALQ